MVNLKKLFLSALMINFVFVFACTAVFISTKNLGKFSVPPEEKSSLLKIIHSTSDADKLRKLVLEAEELHETTLVHPQNLWVTVGSGSLPSV
jgi:hypothetical protein